MQFSEEFSTIFGHETREIALIAENKQRGSHVFKIRLVFPFAMWKRCQALPSPGNLVFVCQNYA